MEWEKKGDGYCLLKSLGSCLKVFFIIKCSTCTVFYLNKIKPLKLPLQERQQPLPCQLDASHLKITNRAAAFITRKAMLSFNKDRIVPRDGIAQQACIKTSIHTTFSCTLGVLNTWAGLSHLTACTDADCSIWESQTVTIIEAQQINPVVPELQLLILIEGVLWRTVFTVMCIWLFVIAESEVCKLHFLCTCQG